MSSVRFERFTGGKIVKKYSNDLGCVKFRSPIAGYQYGRFTDETVTSDDISTDLSEGDIVEGRISFNGIKPNPSIHSALILELNVDKTASHI